MGTPTPSGPGKFSERTDKAVSEANRDLPNAGYGEQAQYQSDQQGMPSQAPSAPAPDFASIFGNPAAGVVGLGEGSQQPDTPVTAGADMGAGPDSSALNLPDQQTEDLQAMVPYQPVLEFMANQPGASWAMRNVVRQIKSIQ